MPANGHSAAGGHRPGTGSAAAGWEPGAARDFAFTPWPLWVCSLALAWSAVAVGTRDMALVLNGSSYWHTTHLGCLSACMPRLSPSVGSSLAPGRSQVYPPGPTHGRALFSALLVACQCLRCVDRAAISPLCSRATLPKRAAPPPVPLPSKPLQRWRVSPVAWEARQPCRPRRSLGGPSEPTWRASSRRGRSRACTRPGGGVRT
jgi:hypothetical protein